MSSTIATTIDRAALAEALNQILAAETHSLARHLEEQATPYLTPESYAAWQRVKGAAHLSHDHEKRLSGLIESLDLPPHPGVYPSAVANYHFADLACLLPQLIEEKQSQIAVYQRALRLVRGDAGATETLQSLMAELESQVRGLVSFTQK